MSRSSGRISNATEETPSATKEIRKERREIVNDLCLTLWPHYKSKKKDHGSIKQFIDEKTPMQVAHEGCYVQWSPSHEE